MFDNCNSVDISLQQQNIVEKLKSDRYNFHKCLEECYDWDYLINIFTDIFDKDTFDDTVHNLFIGSYPTNRIKNSSINLIPSREFIDGLTNIITSNNITSVDEVYTDQGLITYLLSKKLQNIKLTASDMFQDSSNIVKLNFYNICKKSVEDYKYYKKIGVTLPEMVIFTKNISTTIFDSSDLSDYCREIYDVVTSDQHKIVIVIAPVTFTQIYEISHCITTQFDYNIRSYCPKIVDKNFSLSKIMGKYYSSTTIVHLFVKKIISITEIDNLFQPAYINNGTIDYYSVLPKQLFNIKSVLHINFIKSIISEYNGNYIDFVKYLQKIVKRCYSYNHINFCQYIYTVDELQFWIECIANDMYLTFDSRIQFLQFYSNCKTIDEQVTNSGLNNFQQYNTAPMSTSKISKIKYNYLCISSNILRGKNCFTPNSNQINEINNEFNKINSVNKKSIVLC